MQQLFKYPKMARVFCCSFFGIATGIGIGIGNKFHLFQSQLIGRDWGGVGSFWQLVSYILQADDAACLFSSCQQPSLATIPSRGAPIISPSNLYISSLARTEVYMFMWSSVDHQVPAWSITYVCTIHARIVFVKYRVCYCFVDVRLQYSYSYPCSYEYCTVPKLASYEYEYFMAASGGEKSVRYGSV